MKGLRPRLGKEPGCWDPCRRHWAEGPCVTAAGRKRGPVVKHI